MENTAEIRYRQNTLRTEIENYGTYRDPKRLVELSRQAMQSVIQNLYTFGDPHVLPNLQLMTHAMYAIRSDDVGAARMISEHITVIQKKQ